MGIVEDILLTKGYSLERLAEEMGVTEKTIRRLLLRSTRTPRFETSFRLFYLHFRLRPDRYPDHYC